MSNYRVRRIVKFRSNDYSRTGYFPNDEKIVFLGNKEECIEWLRKKLSEIYMYISPLIDDDTLYMDYTKLYAGYEIANLYSLGEVSMEVYVFYKIES